MAGTFDGRLAAMAADRTHGAGELARWGLDALAALATACARDAHDKRWQTLLTATRRLAATRASMAAVANVAVAYLDRLLPRRDAAAPDWTCIVETAREELAGELDRCRVLQVQAARPLLANCRRVVTLSRSSTVTAILTEAAPETVEVVVGEARPGCEGRLTVEELLRAGRRARLVTDAALAHAMEESDLLLLGGDGVCADLAVVNKTGSLGAALAARRFGATVWAAVDTFKINPHATAATVMLEEKDPAEVWPEHPEWAENVYFETVPASLIDGYLTEDGLAGGDALRGVVAAWRRRYRAVGLGDQEGRQE